MKRTAFCVVVAAVMPLATASLARERQTAGPSSPRIRTLSLVPAQIDAAMVPALLPNADELTAGDAAALYAKAAQMLPSNLNQQQIRAWLRLPLGDVPQAEAQQVLRQAETSLKQVDLGALCKDCNWPPFVPGTMPAHLKECRLLTQLLCLKARLQIAQGQHDDAVGTMRTGLAMARHLGQGPTVVQGLVGVAMAAMALQRIEDIAQTEDSPNLYPALQALSRPLIDLEKPITSELNSLALNPQYNALTRAAMQRQLEQSFERVRQLMHRLDRDVAALQCIEALRHYAATHDGQLPPQLGDIPGIEVPDDPTTQKPFGYRQDGSKAVLDAAAPEGGQARDAVRYEITLSPKSPAR